MKINHEMVEKNIKFFLSEDVIFQEGQPGNEMYIVLSGEVEIRKAAFGGSQKVLSTLTKGAFFGEMALIDDKPRSASAVCRQDAKVLVINDKVFDNVVEENPDFASKMIKNLAARLRGANKMIEEALAGNTNKVIFQGLQDYARERGTDTAVGKRVGIPDFAYWACQRLGVPDRAVPEIVKILIERGLITTSPHGENEVIVKV